MKVLQYKQHLSLDDLPILSCILGVSTHSGV